MSRSNLVANALLILLVIAVPVVAWQKLKDDPAPTEPPSQADTADPNLALIREGKLQEATDHYLEQLAVGGRGWSLATEGLAQILDALAERLRQSPSEEDVRLLRSILVTAWPQNALRSDNVETAYAGLVQHDMDRAVEIGAEVFDPDVGSILGSVFPSSEPEAATEPMTVEPIVYLEKPRGWVDGLRPEFVWHDASREDADKATYVISLFDGANERIFEETVTGQRLEYPEEAPELIRGMQYRWTVESTGMAPGTSFEGRFQPLDEQGFATVDGLILSYKDRYENELVWRFFLGNMTLERKLYLGAEHCFEKLAELTDADYPRLQLQKLYGPEHLNLPYRFNEQLED